MPRPTSLMNPPPRIAQRPRRAAIERLLALPALGALLASPLGGAVAQSAGSMASAGEPIARKPGAPAPGSPRPRIDLQGHRGARWLLPENTLAGFSKALELGVTTLELDIVATADDVLVVSHDPALNPAITRDASGSFLSTTGPYINTLTYEALQAYDVGRLDTSSRYGRGFLQQQPADGQRIPRLSDVFELVRQAGNTTVRFAIEIKITPLAPDATPGPERMVELLLAQIDAHGVADRVQVLSFDWRALQHLQRQRPGMPTVYLSAQLAQLDNIRATDPAGSPWTAGLRFSDHGSIPRMIHAAGGSHWSSFWRELDAGKIAEAQALGLEVLAWTVNDPSEMERLLDLGVDGIVTDRPDMAVKILTRRGVRW